MSAQREILARFAWDCKTCGKAGTFNLDCYPDVMGLMRRAREAHRAVSPRCRQPCPNFDQIDLPATPTPGAPTDAR